jgi:hypothetical protein
MLAIKGQIAQSIAQIIKGINSQAEIDEATVLGMLEYPPDEKMGDIASYINNLKEAFQYKDSLTFSSSIIKNELKIAKEKYHS